MKTWVVMNQKGGSGKTTTAVNLSAALGEAGQRVLVVDLDPQANASSWLGVTPDPDDRGLLDVLAAGRRIDELIRATTAPGVDVVPASSWLVGADRALAGEPGAETILRRALERLPTDRWDFAFLDCPPGLGLLAVSALTATSALLVPVEASTIALAGLAGLLKTVQAVQDRLNPALHLSAILVCRVDARTNLSRDIVAQLRNRFGHTVLKTTIRETVRLREAWSFGQPVTVYASASAGATDYRAAARELLIRAKKRNQKP